MILLAAVAAWRQVDLILQPLKSELNWPLGVKRPLDFTRARAGSQLGDGIRWQVPFHLLEAIFYYTEGRKVVDLAFQESRRYVGWLLFLCAVV